MMVNMVVQVRMQIILIWDFNTRYRILVYSLGGEFKRILNLKVKLACD